MIMEYTGTGDGNGKINMTKLLENRIPSSWHFSIFVALPLETEKDFM